ncbi:MAG: hypothetical protein V4581_17410 [Bacteroidota bacterium]
MNNLFILLAFTVFISCKNEVKTPQATSDTPEAAADKPTTNADTLSVLEKTDENVADPIAAIRQKVEHINTATLQKKHFEFMCDEKMMVDYFYEDGQIVKIAIDFGTVGDTYAKEGYYYDAGQLVFIYEYVESGPACDDCVVTNEYRSYIAGNKNVKYLKDKKEQPCKKCKFNASSRQYKLLHAKTTEEIKTLLCR